MQDKEKKRYVFFDLIRIVSFLIIFTFHFLSELEGKKVIGSSVSAKNIPLTNVHPAMLAVSLFFLISGAGLMLSDGKDGFSVRRYIRKRFIKIVIPFYIVYLADLALQWYLHGGSPFQPGIPLWRILLTVCCVDEYFAMWGRATFSLGIGEWFLGALVILYAVFPLLRAAMRKNRWVTMGAATVFYIILSFRYPFSIAVYMNVLMKGYDFLVGMFFGTFLFDLCRSRRLNAEIFAGASVCLGGMVFFDFPVSMQIIAASVWVFLLFAFCENILKKTGKKGKSILITVSGYTFEGFLVHHVIIYVISGQYLTRTVLSASNAVLLYAAELAATFVIAFAVRRISKQAEKWIIKIENTIKNNA